MLRRELIMVEPYRQLRLLGHRRRVASASAVVDSGPPVRPRHVVDPSRRLAERRQLQWRHLDADIRLMRALADIMDSKRLDNDNIDFEKYRRLLQGSRTRSVDRATPLPPSPDPFTAADREGKPLRLCQLTAARPRSHSSPSPSPLDQWPDEWLLRHRQQRQQQQQQQQQGQQQRRRRRRRRRSQSRQAAGTARGSAGKISVPLSRATCRPEQIRPDADGSDRDAEGDADGSDRDAEGDEDGSDASGAGDRPSPGSEEKGAGLCQVTPQQPDLRSDPEARDRLRRHGMVLMTGMSGCQCSARRIT